MREIKFRTFRKSTGKMLPSASIWKINFFAVDDTADFIIMQFTGLKDKNGKEIYEGDILRSEADEGVAVVSYSADMARFEIELLAYEIFTGENPEETYYDKLSVVDSYEFGDWNGAEVIGNIYENPELLKGL